MYASWYFAVQTTRQREPAVHRGRGWAAAEVETPSPRFDRRRRRLIIRITRRCTLLKVCRRRRRLYLPVNIDGEEFCRRY